MIDLSAVSWAGLALAAVIVALAIVVWVQAERRRRHMHPGLSARLVDEHLGLAAAGESHRQVAYLNIEVHNDSPERVVIDGVGYRRSGAHRLVPIRDFDAPGRNGSELTTDRLLPPPYILAPGESTTITIYARTLCMPDDLVGIYLHLNDGKLIWLPQEEMEKVTQSCTWVSQVTND